MTAISSETPASATKFTPDDIINAMLAPRARIDVWSHGCRISKFGTEIRTLMIELCRQHWAEYATVRVGRFRSEKKIKRVFVGTNSVRDNFHFHRNQLDFVLNRLSKLNIGLNKLEVVYHDLYEPIQVDFPLLDTRPPRDIQVPVIDYVLTPPDPKAAPSKVVTLQTGKGKATSLDTLIKIPGGWTTMGQISVDDIVTAKDGTPTKVTGVYPQGKLQLYRVVFADGRNVEVCAEHLWRVYYVNTLPHCRWRVVNTLEVLRLISMPNPRVYVDLIDPEVTPEVNLPLDPYVLGVLLGNGHLGNGKVQVSTPDQFIIDELTASLPGMRLRLYENGGVDYCIRPDIKGAPNWVMKSLIDLGVYGKLANRKFVPETYLLASIEQRLALLQGLLDTDGTVQKSGSVSFCTVSPELAANVQYLIRELGGIATMRPRQTYYTHKGEKKAGQLAYEIDIRLKKPSSLFRLPRKKDRTNDNNQYSKDLKLRVMSVVPTEVKPAQCISVDHPDRLFVVNDFIVTHNTFLGLYCIRKLSARAVMVLPGKYIDQWIKRIEEAYGAEPGSLMVVRGMPQLRAVMDMAVAGTFKPRVLIISSKTMFMYLKYYELNGVDDIVPIAPMDLYRTLGVGIRLIDEVHEDFHCNFRQDLYTHIPLTLSLSATLEPDQRILQEMFNIVWPPGTWAPEMPYHKFIAVKALLYRIRSLNGVRWLNFLRQYSHAEFEKSILKSPTLLSNYIDMIIDITRKVFVEKMEPGQKLLIFVARVELATLLADLLAGTFPKLLVNRYVSEDEFDELLAADISVSTLQSAGTAVDIPNLRITLMTTALSNKSSNIQALGRTRPLEDWPDVTPEFYFLAAMDIDKHLQYCEAKKEKLSGKVLSFNEIRTQYIV